MKTLLIVESPSKAKKINKYLGANYVVIATYGHVFDLKSGGLSVKIEDGFEPIYSVIPDKKDRLKAIINSAKKTDNILLAPDPDREGEAISFLLADALKKSGKPIKRVTFNAITKKAVLEGISKPRDLDENLFNAQQARRVLDRIVGFSVSPYLIEKFGPNLSAGRVQSIVVKLIVDRDKEIEEFVPDEYWTINANLIKNQESFIAKYTGKIIDEKNAKKIKKDLENDSYTIKEIDEFEQKKPAPPPLITASLAAAAAGKFKFSATKTMKAAQALYESGLITYMRTDSTRLDPEAIDFCRNWLSNNNYDIPNKPNIYSNKDASQDAHEAIRPTDVENTPKNVYLQEDQQKIYTLIWERFVACQMNPSVYDNVNVTINTSSKHKLKASGKVLKYKGWLEILNEKKEDKNLLLPKLSEGEIVSLIPPGVEAFQKFTKPPSRFTVKTLIEELEKRGIGRPSTYESIMSKICNRSYVELKNNSYLSTDKGKKIVGELSKFFQFMNYDYTANMEDKLDLIAKGELTYFSMLDNFYTPFTKELKQAYMSHNIDYGFRCKVCKNSPMYLHHGKFGYYLACINYPKSCKFTLSCQIENEKPVIKSTKNADENVRCPNCQSAMIKLDGQFGPYYGCSEYPRCKGKKKAPYGKKCPKCENDLYATLFKDQSVLFCMGYHLTGCNYSEPLPKNTVPNPKKIVGKKIPNKIKKILNKKNR